MKGADTNRRQVAAASIVQIGVRRKLEMGSTTNISDVELLDDDSALVSIKVLVPAASIDELLRIAEEGGPIQ